ncbi:MAG TPA: Gfo/Idh/MocA family oxidoreductase [Candidatus Paceibacterota bacterium]|nr:Gfo/Idh/MocA family oxidoreductase [Candidatus Paceibacterota bacterium]HRT55251.1 Gfo/Idh/MocA family oxidoreductase [Candidatus Paceibacterota bacterium]
MKSDAPLLSRRRFLRHTTRLGACVSAAPLVLRHSLLGADAPSKKIVLGMIGMGRQMMALNLKPFLESPDCVVAAVCDVDAWRLEQGLQAVQRFYASKKTSGQDNRCRAYKDFREIIARPDIDAVFISTPDHWHAPMAIAAVKAGKDVSLEKPITRYVNEGRLLADLVRDRQRIFRVDSEFRSLEPFHRAAELVRNGRLGRLHTIRSGCPREVFPAEPEEITPPPPELDYDLWLGPAPEVPYIQKRVHPPKDLKSRPGWMRNLDYCDGMITNWGTHLNDIAQWANDTERTGPVEVKATGTYHQGKVWNVLESFDAWYRFANGVQLFYQMGEPHVRFEGEKGWIQVNYIADRLSPERLKASDPAILREKIGPGEIHFPLQSEKTDFIEAVKTRRPTLEDAEVGQRTTSLCHLAHIAIQLGGVHLRWDPDRERFENNDAANQLLNRPPLRPPWKLG